MKTRQIIILVAGVLFIALGFAGFKFLSGMKKAPKQAAEHHNAKYVEVFTVANTSVPTYVSVTGKITAADKIDVYAEVQGVLTGGAHAFKEGTKFRKGEVLLKIKDDDIRMNLLSQKSNFLSAVTGIMPDMKLDYPESYPNWEEYLKGYRIEGALQPLPEASSEKERIFVAARGILNQYYAIKAMEETLAKYTIYAPFDGVLIESAIDEGAVVRPQQRLGQFINPEEYELEASTYLEDLTKVNVGDSVQLYSPDIRGQWMGRVKRIGDRIDQSTQTVRVFVSVEGKHLKEGMYLKGKVFTDNIENAFVLDKKLLESNDMIFVVSKDSTLKLRPVEIATEMNGSVVIQGVPENTITLKTPVVGAYENMKVNPVSVQNIATENEQTANAKLEAAIDTLNTNNRK